MPIETPQGNLDIKNATLRTSNLETQNIKIGSIFVGTGNSLEETANVGNSMSNTIQFTNTHTAFTTTGNVEVGGELVVNILSTSNVGQIKVDSNVVTEYTGPHAREPKAVPLKKYPEIAFEKGKFDHNTTTNTFVQAGYTITSSGNYSDDVNSDYTAWRAFTGLINLFDPGWVSPFSSYTSGVANSTQSLTNIDTATSTDSVSSRNGAWIKLELPTKIKLGRVDFYDRYDDIEGTATQYERVSEAFVYGGNNNSGPWYELGKQSDATNIANYTDDNPASLTINTTSHYKYYIIQPTQLAKTISYASYGQLMFYGYEEDPPLGDTSVDTTFTSIMNTPQTTGANVYTDAKLSSDFTNQVTGPTPVGTAAVHDNTNKYWEMNGQLTSNITVEANTFLEGDQPHAVSVWFNSSNLEANVSNTCVFSVSDQEKLDSVNLDLQSNTWHNLTYAYQGEGGSRVTYLDGRKVSEDQAEDTFGDYPPFAMTGYSQGGYVVSSSGRYDGNTYWYEYEAFNKITSGTNGHLSQGGSGRGLDYYNDGSGGYTRSPPATIGVLASTGATINQGEFLKIEMPNKIIVNYISQIAMSDRARDFKWYGSNDDYNWIQLLSVVDAPNDTNKHTFTTTTKDAFRYFALVVSKVYSTTHQYFRLDDIRLYGHRENDLVRLPDPTNVLKYPHIAMTGQPGTANGVTDLTHAQRGYVVTASSMYVDNSTNPFQPWRAFNNETGSSLNGTSWVSTGLANTYGGGSGAYGTVRAANLGSDSGGIATPENGEWLKVQLPHKIVLSHIQMVGNSADTSDHPKSFKLYGSINGTTWVEVISVTNTGVQDTSTGTTFTPGSTPDAYNYFGLVVTALQSRTNYATVTELKLYGTGVDSIPIKIGGGNIDKVANFRVYDKFVGEDQALEIWDAQKDEFGRAKSSMTLQKGRLGLGTTEPEGRLAVADEPHNLEEFPPRAMTGYKTYFEGHGEFCVYASTDYVNSNHEAWKPFNKFRGNDGWHTNGSNYTSGVYTAGKSLGGISGDYLVLKLPYKINLKSIAMVPRDGLPQRGPGSGVILGSNDEVIWEQVHSFSGITYTDNVYTTIDAISSTKTYNVFAMVVTNLAGTGVNTDYLNLAELRYFGTREQGQSVLHDGQLTLTKSLNVPRIGPPLDADDTPRRDRLVVEYNTSTNPTFEGAVRDTSGRGLDGILYNGASYDATEKALTFVGSSSTDTDSSDKIQVYYDWGSTAPAHTFSVWFKRTVNLADWEWICSFGQATSAGNPGILISGDSHSEGGNIISFDIFNDQVTVQHTVELGVWTHVVATFNAASAAWSPDNCKIYVNGELKTGTNAAVGNISLVGNEITLGATHEGKRGFTGQISNFKLYDVALTAQEAKTLYDMGRCDEGHHVVNFSKTRVGIGLGDGEAPRGALDVRGETPFIGPGLVIHQAASGNWGTEGDPANMNGLLLTLEGETGLTTGSSYWNIASQVTGNSSLLFAHRGKATAYIQSGNSNNPLDFTGQHRTFIKDVPFSQAGDLEGLIVSSDQNKYIKISGGIETGSNAIMINESLPVVSLSTTTNDKKCFGVISASEDPEQRSDAYGSFVTPFDKEKGDTRVYINSVGEGAIWVVNTNGSLESGDYITTSNVAGYGQKQDGAGLMNYTVAKITMDCDFEPATQPVQQILRSNVIQTYYLGNVHKVKSVPHEFVTTTVGADDTWSNVSVSPSDVTYAEWSNLEANTQNTYTLTYTQTSNVVYDTKYTLTTTANVTESDPWDRVSIDPPTVTYAEYSNLEANTQNTYTLTFTQTTTDEKTPEEWSALESNTQSLYNTVYYQSVEEEVASDYPGATTHTRVTDRIENELDEHGQIQWEDHSTETEKAYKIRYLDASGVQTDEANAVHIAAFVGCTYHCG